MSRKKIKYWALAILLVAAAGLEAQNRISSPYSRFGVGDLDNNTNGYYLSMGSTSLGMRSPLYINTSNPASYTSIVKQSFVFQGSVYDRYADLKTETLSEAGNYSSLGTLLFGFPVTNWWKASFGLLPYSKIGYNVNTSNEVDEVGTVLNRYEGNGGLSRFYVGNAVQLGKYFSIGANVSYMFGNIDRTNSLFFPDSLFLISSRNVRSINVQDIYYEYGIQYHNTWENDLFLNIGATYHNSFDLNAEQSVITETFLGDPEESVSAVKDTISFFDQDGSVSLPARYGFGFTIGKQNRWKVGADYEMQEWENYQAFGNSNDTLVNTSRISVGAEITPDATSLSNYWRRMRYRLGFRYYNSYLELRDNRIEEFGISFGVGLPIRGSSTMINLGAELGKRGTTANGLIEENFIRLSVGLSLQELWFIKRKYN